MTAPPERPTLRLQVGTLKLSGRAAAAVALILLLAIAALIVLMRPRIGMLISGTLWAGFVLYWSAAAKHAASIERSESRESRRVHARLLNVALLLLFIPVPGLRGRVLPPARDLIPGGLALQSAGFLLAVWARRHLGANWRAPSRGRSAIDWCARAHIASCGIRSAAPCS